MTTRSSGGSGNDRLFGEDGNDSLDGGSGDDWLSGAAGTDDIHGGDGTDEVVFTNDFTGAHISLDDQANDGAAGEGDNAHSDIENIDGTSGSDVIVGSAADNVINDGGGLGTSHDDITGGAGRDTIVTGNPARIDVADGEADSVRCVSSDTVLIADPIDTIDRCTSPPPIPSTLPPPVLRGAGARSVRISRDGYVKPLIRCAGSTCVGALRLRSGTATGPVIGRAVIQVLPGRAARPWLHVPRPTQRRLARARRQKAVLMYRPEKGGWRTLAHLVLLRPKR